MANELEVIYANTYNRRMALQVIYQSMAIVVNLPAGDAPIDPIHLAELYLFAEQYHLPYAAVINACKEALPKWRRGNLAKAEERLLAARMAGEV